MNHDQAVVKETKKTQDTSDGVKGSLSESLITDVSNKELETTRKAWFKHVLLNIEKLYCIAEEGRKENIINLQILRDDIKDLADKINKKMHNEDKVENKKTDTTPAKIPYTVAFIAGGVGGLAVVLIACVVKVFFV